METKVCKYSICGRAFQPSKLQLKNGGGKYCSVKCSNKHHGLLRRQPIAITEFGIIEKQCSQCEIFKPREAEFYRNSGSHDGYAVECKVCSYIRYVEKTYPITRDELDLMFLEQDGVCLLCHELCARRKHLSIDRCKYSGIIRGLLCQNCINGLSKAYYNPLILRAAVTYLTEAPTLEIPRWRIAWRENWSEDPTRENRVRQTVTGEREQFCPHCKRYKLVQENFRNKRTESCSHPDWCDLCKYFDYTEAEYDLNDASYEALLQSQQYGCRICGKKCSVNRMLSVDHDHQAAGMKIRGLLCFSCNLALGCFKDDIAVIERAAQYVEGFAIPFLAQHLPLETMTESS